MSNITKLLFDIFNFNTCTLHYYCYYYNQQIHNYIITVYITTVSLCNLYSYMLRRSSFIIREFTPNVLLSYTHGFRPEFSCESQVVTVCQDIANSLDKGVRTDAIIIDFSNTFDLVPHDRLLTKIAGTGVDLRVVVCVKEFLVGRSQRVKSRRATI